MSIVSNLDDSITRWNEDNTTSGVPLTIVLDMDETLVHSTEEGTVPEDGDFMVLGYAVRKRPYLEVFLNYLLGDPDYEVGIWTAGTHDYAHGILDNIVHDKSVFSFIMTRENCDQNRNKPLFRIKDKYGYNIHAHDILIIDDKDGVTCHHHLNHLKIKEFEGDMDDTELYELMQFLEENRDRPSEYYVCNWRIK